MSDNLHLAWCRLLARGLAASGVREVVISPGSRSTPLVLGFDAEPALRKHTIIDERAAAFFALGLARSTGLPVALLCTSGTAGAHYLPAVIEASQAGHPLVIITADRPWEAYDCAASQTIDQVKLFGDHVRHFAELGLPERSALPAVMRIAAQAVHRATHPAGAVHINARFRKPLEPVDAPRPEPHEAEVAALLAAGPTRFFAAERELSTGGLAALAALCREHERGLLVAGPAPSSHVAAAPALRALSERLGYPLCAEVTSQLRQGPAGALGVPSFDALLRNRAFMGQHAPELIIEIGGPPVSSAYGNWLASRPRVRRVVLAPHGWSDPHGTADLILEVAGPSWVERLASLDVPARASSWSQGWVAAQRAVDALGVDAAGEATRVRVPSRSSANTSSVDEAPLTDADVASAVARGTPAGSALLLGNSGPIRDLDAHPGQLNEGVRVMHQRGAAGIDGWLAAAAGTAAGGAGEATVLYLGDVALLHDIGSLSLVASVRSPLAIVVVNNDGGRLFEQLPVARRPEIRGAFERHFLTSHGLTFGPIAAGWGIAYANATTRAQLDEALARAVAHPGPTLIEATVDAGFAAARRQERQRAVEAALAGLA